MGYLNTANDMVENVDKALGDVLKSKFATHLQGNGTPVLVTYYHVDDTLSTSDWGNYTADQILGVNSPIRYNRIENFPLVGLRELIPSIDMVDENLMDMSIEGEVTSFPGTIKPTPLDIFLYRYGDNNTITFRVTGIELTSIRNNDFYKMSISLKDINDMDTINKVEKQCIKGYVAKVDNIGTQDRCIIEDKIYYELDKIERLINHLIENYKILFYDRRYNCLVLRDSVFAGYPIYDPYLTTFVEKHDLLDSDDEYAVIQNFDYRPQVDKWYRQTIWRYLETRNSSKLSVQKMSPTSFSTTDTNPFYYYGEENGFTLDLSLCEFPVHPDTEYIYGDRELLLSIMYHEPHKNQEKPARPSPEGMKENQTKPILSPVVDEINHFDSFDDLSRFDSFSNPDNPKLHTIHNVKTEEPRVPTDDELSDIYDEDYTDESFVDIPCPVQEIKNTKPEEAEPITLQPEYLTFIRDYFIKDTLYDLFSLEDIDNMFCMDIDHSFRDFMHIPMLIYVLKEYKTYLTNNR